MMSQFDKPISIEPAISKQIFVQQDTYIKNLDSTILDGMIFISSPCAGCHHKNTTWPNYPHICITHTNTLFMSCHFFQLACNNFHRGRLHWKLTYLYMSNYSYIHLANTFTLGLYMSCVYIYIKSFFSYVQWPSSSNTSEF